jgi:hypothetical protein
MCTSYVPFMHCEKIAATYMSFRQRAVTEFLLEVGNSAGVIYDRLRDVYGDVCMGVSNVRRWVKHFKDGNTDIADQPRCGRPRTVATVREIVAQLGVGHLAVQEMMGILGIGKFIPIGFPFCLRVQRNTKRLGAALPSTLHSGYGPLRLPLVRAFER